ncbi:hypothetical protein INR49_030930 [Caranx melampygus]|nr:hypothetical protein INR49_030930 [Caranx melampygus]
MATRWAKVKQDEGVRLGNRHLVENIIQGTDLRRSSQPSLQEIWPESAAFPGMPERDETGSNFATNSSSWSVGFHGVQGKVLAPSFDSSPHFSEWLAMRPLVQCSEKVMTFTASGQGLTHLLVDREGASPISLFQLPPFCGYTVRTSWSDLEMMVPYDACYITQENDSYVLPMLWWGSPLKLSCPVQMSSPAPSSSLSAPSVFCSPFGMAVQMYGQEQDIPLLGVMSMLEGLHLYLLSDDKEYILSCPASPQSPFLPDPVSPAPTSPPPPLLSLQPRSRLLNFWTTITIHTLGSSTPTFLSSIPLAHNPSIHHSPLKSVLQGPSPSSSPSTPWSLASCLSLLKSTQKPLPSSTGSCGGTSFIYPRF